MASLTPKQIEIRDREQKILAVARPLVVNEGLSGLSMNSIAQQISYTKGTIYNHFGCKEEVLLALAIQASETRFTLFDVAQNSETGSRDRMAAIGIACEEFRTRFDDLFQIESMVRHATVWEKASVQRREMMLDCESRTMGLVAGVAGDAVKQGDLKIPRKARVEELVFGLWSLTYGGMLIDASSPGLQQIGISNPLETIRNNCNAIMDGWGWQPLHDRTTYKRLLTRVRKTLRKQVPEIVSTPPESPSEKVQSKGTS